MSVVFANSPILETVCDFRFEEGQTWDWTVPGLLYERVRQTFPLKQEQRTFDVNMSAILGGEASPSQQIAMRLQFLREDKGALVQVGQNFLAVNHLRPYPTWLPFRNMILQNLDDYVEVAKPKGIRTIGLRYINQIDFPNPEGSSPFPVSEYITAIPGIPTSLLRAPVSNFLQRVEIPSPNGLGVLAIQSGTVPSEKPERFSCLLDLAFSAIFREEMLPLEAAKEWIERAHLQIEEAFLECITRKARELFGERNND